MGFNDDVIAEFRANNGQVGGPFAGAPMLLLHHKGIASGKDYVTPLVFQQGQGVHYIFASAAGSDTDPQWYRNLAAGPSTTIEVAGQEFSVAVTELSGDERDRVYAAQVAAMPGFGDYEKRTTRVIPVLALTEV